MPSAALLLTLLALNAAVEPAPPGPKERVAGYFGLAVSSRIETAEQAAELEVWYSFPDRARRSIVPVEGRESSRALVLRYGESLWTVAPLATESVEQRGEEQARLLRSFGLRRALFLWPHGFAWSGEGSTRNAEFGEVGGELVLLQATIGPDGGRPEAMRVLADDGRVLAAMNDVRWNPVADRFGRRWPQELTYEEGGLPVWRETVHEVAGGRLADAFFVPVDRREEVRGRAVARARVVELPEVRWSFTRLPEGTSIDAGVALADAALAALLAGDPDAPLARSPLLALDAGGRPTGYWLTGRPDQAAPAEWAARPARAALSVHLTGPGALNADTLTTLSRAASDRGWTRAGLLLRVRPAGEAPRRAEALLLLEGR